MYTIAPGAGALRLARSSDNFPALLIATTGGGLNPRRLANLRFDPPVGMVVTRADGGSEQTAFAVLLCTTRDLELQRYFCRAINSFFGKVGDAAILPPTAAEIGQTLDGVTSLFSSLSRASKRSVRSLWAELAFVVASHAPEIAISAWHSSPNELHAFKLGSCRLEVKSSTTALREHIFHLDQLTTKATGETLIASIVLQERLGGTSLFELCEQVESKLDRGSSERLQAIIASSLGESWRDADADHFRFDFHATMQSLVLYRCTEIPRIPEPLPIGIKDVVYTADLSTAVSLPLEQARALTPFYRSILPRSKVHA